MLGGDDHPDRQPDVGAHGAELGGALDVRAQSEAEQLRVAAVLTDRHGDGEAAPADPPDESIAIAAVQAPAHLTKQIVPHLVAEGVVDLVEGVDRDCGDHQSGPRRQGLAQPPAELTQVGQPGQGVCRGGAGQVGLQPTALEGPGQLGPDGLDEPDVAEVEVPDRAEAVGDGEQAQESMAAEQRDRHPLRGLHRARTLAGVLGVEWDEHRLPPRLVGREMPPRPMVPVDEGKVEVLGMQQDPDPV